jgi:hypothetical protein
VVWLVVSCVASFSHCHQCCPGRGGCLPSVSSLADALPPPFYSGVCFAAVLLL